MKKNVEKTIENLIYILVFIPLVIIIIRILYQTKVLKKDIPDIFGYKLFVILDGGMDSSFDYGNLVIIYDESIDKIKENDYIAYRNGNNTIAIHKVEKVQKINDIYSNENQKTFVVSNSKNEGNNNQKIKEEKIEGVKVKKIPKLGLIMYYIAQPKTIIIISCLILIIGGICIYIAKELDKKETMRQKK